MITKESQRILWNDSGTLRDLTIDLNDFRNNEQVFSYSTGDYLYIGSEAPFSFRYFDLGVLNTAPAEITVEYWRGNDTWHPAVDVLDETEGFTKSGYISWKTDRNSDSWTREQDSFDVTGLTGTVIYNMFWLRISFDVDLDVTTEIDTINFKFSDDDQLYGRYPDLNNQLIKDNFERGFPSGTKTDWNEQHYIAAEAIVRDIKKKNYAFSGDQIIDFELFEEAGQHKAAELIYGAMGGEGYEMNRKRAREYYNDAMNQGFMRLDQNMNARLDCGEKQVRQVNLQR